MKLKSFNSTNTVHHINEHDKPHYIKMNIEKLDGIYETNNGCYIILNGVHIKVFSDMYEEIYKEWQE